MSLDLATKAAAGRRLGVPGAKRPAMPVSRTLRRMRLLQTLVLLAVALWAGVALVSLVRSRAVLDQASKTFIPASAAAQSMEASLAAMDATFAEQLARASGAKEARSEAGERDRTEVVRALIDAAESGGTDREALASVEAGLGTYGQLQQRVRDLHERGDGAQWEVYRQAVATVDGQLLPRAEGLDKAAEERLQDLAGQQRRFNRMGTGMFLVASLLLLAVLLAAQVYLSRRTKRTLNPGLLAATAVCVVATGNLLQAGSLTPPGTQVVFEKAYPALHAGWRARTAAARAREEEDRATLDGALAMTYRATAAAERAAVATVPPALHGDELLAALRERRSVDGFHGFLSDEMEASQQPGERQAVTDALETWIDVPSAASARGGRGRTVVPGETSGAFGRALNRALAAHERVLTQAVDGALAEQTRAEAVLALCACLAAFFALLGFAPRLREYKE